jgi:hypothetical protein
MLGSRSQANLIVSGGNSSHNSKTEYGFQSLTCLFLHFNPWNLMENNANLKIRRTEQTRFGRAWTTLRVSDSMRRINYTSKRSIHSTESYSKNSIGKLPSTVYYSSYSLQGLITFLIQISARRTRSSGRAGARRS